MIPPLHKVESAKEKKKEEQNESEENETKTTRPRRLPSWKTINTRLKRHHVKLLEGFTRIGFQEGDLCVGIQVVLPMPSGSMSCTGIRQHAQVRPTHHLPMKHSPYGQRKMLGKQKIIRRRRARKKRKRKKASKVCVFVCLPFINLQQQKNAKMTAVS